MNQLLEALKAIPVILPLLEQLVAFAKKNFGEDWKKVFADATESFKQLNNAKTPEEKVDAGRRLQDIFSKLNILLVGLMLTGCAGLDSNQTDLKVEMCISDPVNKGFQCVRPDRTTYVLPYVDSENYTAFSTKDFQAITRRLIECKESQALCIPNSK